MGESFGVSNPATGELIETVELAGPAEVDRAVRTARTAFASWSRTTPADRSGALHRLATSLERMAADLARTESLQTGKPIKLSTDVPGTIDNTSYFAGAARHLDGLAAGEYSADHTSSVRREPIGVVGSIAIGTGPVAGEALVSHPDVDMVSFTGSTTVGRRVMTLAAEGIKRVHLELGGKAPFVVFDDAQLDAAVQGAVAGALINAGQDCTAATRAIVHRSVFDSFVAGVADTMASVVVGDPFDPATDLGPLRVDQRPHPDRERTATRRLQAVGIRQRHVAVLVGRVHLDQARDVRPGRRGPQVLASHDIR